MESYICLLIGLAMLLAFAVWIVREGNENDAIKRRKLARRFCVRCGYNVHQNTDRCPECGTPIEAESIR
jgi:hypothetical protein